MNKDEQKMLGCLIIIDGVTSELARILQICNEPGIVVDYQIQARIKALAQYVQSVSKTLDN